MATQETVIPQIENPIIHSFLARRALTERDVAYLTNPNEQHQHDPFLLKGVGRWIDTLHAMKGLPFVIIPDYDADGVLSGTLARVGLYLFGFGDVYVYPPKTCDGYGLSKTSIDNVLKARPETRVIITTDNGSNAHEGIQYAKEKGLTVLVTDHHLAADAPNADAVVNPNGHGDNTYPFTHISGTAVIYKVLTAYACKYVPDPQIRRDFRSLVLLVGISTISDVMPLVNENRFYVKESVNMLRHFVLGHSIERLMAYDDSPLHQYYRGVDLLVVTLEKNGKLKYGVDSDTFGFIIGPMLNSPRRMTGESEVAFQLFQSTRASLVSGQPLPSDLLYEMNEQRKAYVQALKTALFTHIHNSGGNPLNYLVFNARMSKGIAGLLSGKFTEAFGLPSIAFSAGAAYSEDEELINVPVTGDRLLVGSARSPETFDLHGFLTMIDEAYPGLIEKWGGHPQAAGLSIRAENFERFREVFTTWFAQLMAERVDGAEEQVPSVFAGEYVLTTEAYDDLMLNGATHASDVIPLHGNTSVFTNHTLWEAVRFFEQLEPFGNGFPKPTFSVAVSMRDVPRVFRMGAEQQHAKLMLTNGLSVIHWNGADVFMRPESEAANLAPDHRVFIITGELGINEYNGDESLQLIATDVREWA